MLFKSYLLPQNSSRRYAMEGTQTAEYVRFRRVLGGGKLKNLGAGAQKCTRGGLRGGHVLLYQCVIMSCVNIRGKIYTLFKIPTS